MEMQNIHRFMHRLRESCPQCMCHVLAGWRQKASLCRLDNELEIALSKSSDFSVASTLWEITTESLGHTLSLQQYRFCSFCQTQTKWRYCIHNHASVGEGWLEYLLLECSQSRKVSEMGGLLHRCIWQFAWRNQKKIFYVIGLHFWCP